MATKTEILAKLADQHEERIVNVLYDLEDDIINSLQATSGGQKLTTQLAIQLRPNLKRLIEENYLKEADLLVRDYDKVIKNYQSFIKKVPIADRFKTLTKPDLAVINQLKQLSFSGFEDVANRFLTTISDEVYKSAIVGKPFPDMVKAIRGEINGVYQRSNENAIKRLVNIVDKNKYSDSAISKKLTADATRILHTKYASDRVGRNMRLYASQQAHDSIMQFDAQFTKYKAEEAGITSFQYTGTNITTTREFCRARIGNVYTEEEARSIWGGNWKGKSGSDPFIDRGGYRCRHSFIPYDPAWDNIDEVQDAIVPDVQDIVKPTDVVSNLSSLANPIKRENITPVSKAYLVKKLSEQFTKNNKDKKYQKNIIRFRGRTTFDYGKAKFANKTNRFGTTFKYTNEDYGAFEAIFKELDELAIKYNVPKLRGVISVKNARRGDGETIASMGDGIIALNTKYVRLDRPVLSKSSWKRGQPLDKRPELSEEFFDNPLERIRSTMYHEFAHHIHHQKFVKNGANYFDPKLEQKLYKLAGTEKGGNAGKLTGRGATEYSDFNPKEWFAENFSLYEMERSDLTDPRFIKFMKDEVL